MDFLERVSRQILGRSAGKINLGEARKIARRHLRKSGLMEIGSEELTPKGKARASLSPATRAFQRSKISPEEGGIYDPLENKAVFGG